MSSDLRQSLFALLGLLVISALVIGAGMMAISQTPMNAPTVAFEQSATTTLKIVMLTMMTPTQTNPTAITTATPAAVEDHTMAEDKQEIIITPSTTKTDIPTAPSIQCYTPASWVAYIVQPGENLYRIGLKFRIDTITLQKGNCMGTSTTIIAGQHLWVPNVATSTPETTSTSTPKPGFTPEPTLPNVGTTTASTESVSSTDTTGTQQSTQATQATDQASDSD